MDVEDFIDPEVAAAAAVTAALFSKRVRGVLRQGAVYGVAGTLIAGDAITSFARGLGQGVQRASTAAAGAVQAKAGGTEHPEETASRGAEQTHEAPADDER